MSTTPTHARTHSRSWRRATITLVAIGVAWVTGRQIAVSRAQGGAIEVVNAHFVRTLTQTTTGTSARVEEGTILIASDGRYRIERVRNGERTAEIWTRDRDRRIALNLDTKQGVVGSSGSMVIPPSTGPRQVPSGVPDAWKRDEHPRVNLGTKTVGALTLRGTGFSTTLSQNAVQITNNREVWAYHFPDSRIVPIILETRFEMPDSIDEQRVTDSTTIRVDAAVFEAPPDFSIRQLP
jgi:hypothetical protein